MPHEPTSACEADHCAFHNEDEPAGAGAIVCGECLHTYPTPEDLYAVDAQLRADLNLTPVPLAGITTADFQAAVDAYIYVCPLCAHDF